MKNKNLGLLVQAVLCMCSIIFYIISMIEREFLNVAQIIFALTLFVFAFNNHMTFKRKYFTLLYAIFGAVLLIGALVNILV